MALVAALVGMKARLDEISFNAAVVACGKRSWEMALSMFGRQGHWISCLIGLVVPDLEVHAVYAVKRVDVY